MCNVLCIVAKRCVLPKKQIGNGLYGPIIDKKRECDITLDLSHLLYKNCHWSTWSSCSPRRRRRQLTVGETLLSLATASRSNQPIGIVFALPAVWSILHDHIDLRESARAVTMLLYVRYSDWLIIWQQLHTYGSRMARVVSSHHILIYAIISRSGQYIVNARR